MLLGSAAPAQYIDPDDETLVGLYGLLQACGTPASDDSHGLKRSARPAMELTKQLIFDFKDESGKKEGPKNVIATSFLSLPVKYYAHMQLHVHCRGEDTRAAAKEEACQIVLHILEHHLTEDGEKPSPVMVDDVLHNPKAQQVFERTFLKGHYFYFNFQTGKIRSDCLYLFLHYFVHSFSRISLATWAHNCGAARNHQKECQ